MSVTCPLAICMKILADDDERAIRFSLAELLESDGHEAIVVSTAHCSSARAWRVWSR
jgi:DNA-binding response OmpR family regulator